MWQILASLTGGAILGGTVVHLIEKSNQNPEDMLYQPTGTPESNGKPTYLLREQRVTTVKIAGTNETRKEVSAATPNTFNAAMVAHRQYQQDEASRIRREAERERMKLATDVATAEGIVKSATVIAATKAEALAEVAIKAAGIKPEPKPEVVETAASEEAKTAAVKKAADAEVKAAEYSAIEKLSQILLSLPVGARDSVLSRLKLAPELRAVVLAKVAEADKAAAPKSEEPKSEEPKSEEPKSDVPDPGDDNGKPKGKGKKGKNK